MTDIPRRTVLGSAAVGILGGMGTIPRVRAQEQDTSRKSFIEDRPVPLAYSEEELVNNLMSGGVSVDGIPSIDSPTFTSAENAPDQLSPGDPVFGISVDGAAKAYPQYILVYHEIVNDEIGGEPIAVTYCPLTGTPQGFHRGSMELGVSGMLLNSNLVMYNRGGNTYWPQMLGMGIDGDHSGDFLSEFRVVWTTWERWQEHHPDTEVLTEDTGHIRDYGTDPYGTYNPIDGYYGSDNVHFPVLNEDDRRPPKEMMLGVRTKDGAIAVPKSTLADATVISDEVGEAFYHVVYDDRLETGWFYRSDQPVDVEATADGYAVDGGSSHPPDELSLEPVLTMDAMWFAWAAYFPDTSVFWGPEGTRNSNAGDDGNEEEDEETTDSNMGDDGSDEDSAAEDSNEESSQADDETTDGGGREAVADDGETTADDDGDDDALPGFGALAGISGVTAAWFVARKFGLFDQEITEPEE